MVSRDFRTWKRYRGGMAPDIWLFDLEKLTSRRLTDDLANDAQPMWNGEAIYFLSDRGANKRANLWKLDPATGTTEQLTSFKKFDIMFPGMGPGEIVFSAGPDLYLFDLKSEKERKIEIQVITDEATLKPHSIKLAERISGGGISPHGKRAVLEARGEIFTIPAEHGVTRNLTNTSGVAERSPAWSPDGEWIAYWSDRSGEYELTLRKSDGSGAEKTLTSMGPGFRYDIFWSPDSKKMAYVDQAMKINYYSMDTDKVVTMTQGLYLFHGNLSSFRVGWSADSRWATFARDVDNRNSAIFIYDTSQGDLHQVTSGFNGEAQPEFDPDGKYLYFLSSRTYQPSYSDMDNSWIYANTTNVVAVPLRADVASPLAARNDDEELEKDEKGADDGEKNADEDQGADDPDKGADNDGEKGEKKNNGKGKKADPVEIDLDGFERRAVVLPPEGGNYADLRAVSGKVVYRRLARTGAPRPPRDDDGDGSENRSSVVFFDLKKREEKTVIDNVGGYEISADGKSVLVATRQGMAIVKLAPKQTMEKKLDTSAMQMTLDPRAEWRQIFNDAWRLERDYFYDPDLHGVDWDAMKQRYGAMLDFAVTRWDLNFILGELLGELNSSHAYRGGGDTEQSERGNVGLLGADFTLENGAFRIKNILDGGAWDSEVRSPLLESGIKVKEGDYLLAVNGVPLDTARDPWAAFQGLAGRTVELTVGETPDLADAHKILLQTMSDDERLRNLAWIENNRKKVEEATDGRVGYLYVPSTGIDGQTELVRMWRGQVHKDGLIVDERFNSGGQIPDRFVELLNRPRYNYWGVRDGRDWTWPPVAHEGKKVMLINGWSGSGGDAFPFYFREAGLGPLIGTRTWGGLIGISGAPRLIDGGVVTVPTFGIYSNEGDWIIEGHGVDPDIEVLEDPALMVDGGDPQLDRAIQEVLKALRADPVKEPGKPRYEDRSGY
jgi:tricorn protease